MGALPEADNHYMISILVQVKELVQCNGRLHGHVYQVFEADKVHVNSRTIISVCSDNQSAAFHGFGIADLDPPDLLAPSSMKVTRCNVLRFISENNRHVLKSVGLRIKLALLSVFKWSSAWS